MPLVRPGVDDMALDVPRTAERRGGKSGRSAAAEPHAERNLASHATLHPQPRERVLMGRQVVRALAFVIPAWMLGFACLDFEPQVDRHRHAVEARTNVGDRGGNFDAHYRL